MGKETIIGLIDFLAIWGAIVSTAAMTWNIVRDIRDKGKLKIDVVIGKEILIDNAGKIMQGHTDEKQLVISITNVGRRPVLVKGWGGMLKNNQGFFVPSRKLPQMLKEGEYLLDYTSDLSILSQNLKTIYVWDSADKKWAVSRKNLKQLFKNAERVTSANTAQTDKSQI
jgi:ABC-type antimicrobial peptide transport system permease subunit